MLQLSQCSHESNWLSFEHLFKKIIHESVHNQTYLLVPLGKIFPLNKQSNTPNLFNNRLFCVSGVSGYCNGTWLKSQINERYIEVYQLLARPTKSFVKNLEIIKNYTFLCTLMKIIMKYLAEKSFSVFNGFWRRPIEHTKTFFNQMFYYYFFYI